MAPVQRRLRAGWNRRSRIDARLWILSAALLVIAFGAVGRIRRRPPRIHPAARALVGVRARLLRDLTHGGDRQSSPRCPGDHPGRRTVRGRTLPRDAARAAHRVRDRHRLSPQRPGDHGRSGRPRSTSSASRCSRRWESGRSGRSPGPEPPGLAQRGCGAIAATAIVGPEARTLGERGASGHASGAPGSMWPTTCAPPTSRLPRQRCASG